MKRKVLSGLIIMDLLLGLVFLIAMLNLKRGVAIFGSGLGIAENYAVIVITIIGIAKMTYEIIKLEM